VPHRRRVQKGSFASPLDELIAQFAVPDVHPRKKPSKRSPELQEKIDIHTLLFERAWQVEN
jgi:hypothetical protein